MPAPPLTLSSGLGGFQALDIIPRGPVSNAQLFADVTDGAVIPHRDPDFGEFLSVKPFIPFSQEVQEVLVLVSQIQNHEPLSWEVEHMNPHEVVEHPSCGRVLDARAFLVWKGGLMRLEGSANPILQGCIHQQADGHHHQERHDAFGLFEIERGGQKLRVFQEAKSPFRLGLAFITGEQFRQG